MAQTRVHHTNVPHTSQCRRQRHLRLTDPGKFTQDTIALCSICTSSCLFNIMNIENSFEATCNLQPFINEICFVY